MERLNKKIFMEAYPIVRKDFPNSVKDKIKSEFAIIHSKTVEVKPVQEIQIYDPRRVMYGPDLGYGRDDPRDKVQIRRVVKLVPVEKLDESIYSLIYCHTIEVIKEYTFLEWDSVLDPKRYI